MASDLFEKIQGESKPFNINEFAQALSRAKQEVQNPDAVINVLVRSGRVPQSVLNSVTARAQQIQQMLTPTGRR